MNFEQLGLISPLLKAVSKAGYETPTPIQQAAISAVLENRDVMASAQTGTGKTAAFTLPILQKLADSPAKKHPRALIVTPTRELAAQIKENADIYGHFLDLHSTTIFGGVKQGPQVKSLRQGTDILIATPGRLLDLYQQKELDLQFIEIVVLDEADRMLDMGFIHDIKRILAVLPAKRQSLMFSATFSPEIRKLGKTLLNNPVEIDVAVKNSTASAVKQQVFPVDKSQKAALLAHLLEEHGWHQSLVFTRTKHGANALVRKLEKSGLKAAAIHGNKSQANRSRTLAAFHAGNLPVLVATDIASRGIDIDELPVVVNYDLPNVPEDYVHRVGRTARAGSSGLAISLVSADESKQLRDIEKLIQRKLDRESVAGFEPSQAVPESQIPASSKAGRGQGQSGNNASGQRKRTRNRNQRGNDRTRSAA